jgi:arylsulfatase A-like enzyme/Tfp pilus assembly protein PilF
LKRALYLLFSSGLWIALAFGAPARLTKPPINVIFVTIDTLRADHVGCYGAKQVKTPTIDSLCRDGIVFERAYAQVPLTWPSHAVMLTGTYPFQNGVQDFTGQPLSSRFRTVAEAFQRRGYATGAVVSSFVLDRSWGLARGFDFYDDAFSSETFQKKDLGLVERKAGESVDRAMGWLEKSTRRPFFLWLHLYDPHAPYDSPEPFRSEYQDRPYDGEIAYADHELGRLVAWLKGNHIYDDTLIVLLSDHGESLGEHGEQEHGFFIYNATTHIPLIVKPPRKVGIRPSRIDRVVESISVAPTLLAFPGIADPIQKQFQAPGLIEAKSPRDGTAYTETLYPFSSFGWSPLHGVFSGHYHYIAAPQPELYDLSSDPEEQSNVASQQSAVVASLDERLKELLKRNPFQRESNVASGVDPDAAQKLRALGYAAYGSAIPTAGIAERLPDPKTKVAQYNAFLKASDAFRAGDYQEGERILAQLAESEPGMYVVPFMLGEAALRRQQWSEAANQMSKSIGINPKFDQAMTGLAHALHSQSDDVGAQKWLERALEVNPLNYRAWYELGSIRISSDKSAAQSAYEKAVSIQPNFGPAQRELGTLLFQTKQYSSAAVHFEKAIRLGVREPSVFNSLGISYSQTNRLPKAIGSYREAIKLAPENAATHLNLADVYRRAKRVDDARKEYQKACDLQPNFCKFIPK